MTLNWHTTMSGEEVINDNRLKVQATAPHGSAQFCLIELTFAFTDSNPLWHAKLNPDTVRAGLAQRKTIRLIQATFMLPNPPTYDVTKHHLYLNPGDGIYYYFPNDSSERRQASSEIMESYLNGMLGALRTVESNYPAAS